MGNNLQPQNEDRSLDTLKVIWNFMYNNDNIVTCGGIALLILSIGIKLDKKKHECKIQ